MKQVLTAFVLMSASMQTAWAAAAEGHWIAMPAVLGCLCYALLGVRSGMRRLAPLNADSNTDSAVRR